MIESTERFIMVVEKERNYSFYSIDVNSHPYFSQE